LQDQGLMAQWEIGEPRFSNPKPYGTMEFRTAMPALKCHQNVTGYNKRATVYTS